MTSNLHDIRSRSGENAQMTRVERLPGITPPPHIIAESRADGVFGAFKRVFAAAFAASVFTCAAGVGWIDERAATTGRTGAWSESVAYDSVTHAAAICDNVFTPAAPSAGSYVTLKFTATFPQVEVAAAHDKSAQCGLQIGPNGSFQVWTRGGRSSSTAASSAREDTRPPAWLDVSAMGIAPVPGAEYSVLFVLDYAAGSYSVSVKDAAGKWRALQSAAGKQTFQIAVPGAYMLKSIAIEGQTEFTSLEGSYTSGRRGE